MGTLSGAHMAYAGAFRGGEVHSVNVASAANAPGVGGFMASIEASLEARFSSLITRILSLLGLSNYTSSTVSVTRYQWNTSEEGLNNVYVDSSGDTVTIQICQNGAYVATKQTVCQSSSNSCGMTGSGFVTQVLSGERQVGNSQSACSAQKPSDSLCQNPVCTPYYICSTDGNVHNSCTNALVQTCPNGCANGICNTPPSTCTTGYICSTDGNVYDSCTNTLAQTCPNGCANGVCKVFCATGYSCSADGNVYDSCTNTISQMCSDGCTNGVCNTSSTCATGYICGPDGNVHSSCSDGATVKTCSFGCTGSVCDATASAGMINNFVVTPSLVHRGATATVKLSTGHVKSCTLTGSNGDKWTALSGDFTTSPITAQTVYTLTCVGGDGATVTETATVNITPLHTEQ